MRAWRVHELGEPRDVPRLAPANFPDVLMCRGEYHFHKRGTVR